MGFTSGFEAYAKKTHRIHPFFQKWISMHSQLPQHGSILQLDPYAELQTLIYRGDIKLRSDFNSREDLQRIGSVPLHLVTKLLEKLPPTHRIKVRFDRDLFQRAISLTRLYITPFRSLPSGRASPKHKKLTNSSKNSSLLTTTPCFMLFHLQIWAKGILNYPGFHCGNCFDLSTPNGLALYLHEIYHIFQFVLNPWRMLWGYIRSLHDSLVYARIFFSHKHIPFEIEAIAFEFHLIRYFSQADRRQLLKQFSAFR